VTPICGIQYAEVSKETYYRAKETYYKAKETYYKAKAKLRYAVCGSVKRGLL